VSRLKPEPGRWGAVYKFGEVAGQPWVLGLLRLAPLPVGRPARNQEQKSEASTTCSLDVGYGMLIGGTGLEKNSTVKRV
jgi:hypothetical protein